MTDKCKCGHVYDHHSAGLDSRCMFHGCSCASFVSMTDKSEAAVSEFSEDAIVRDDIPRDAFLLIHDLAYDHEGRERFQYRSRAQRILMQPKIYAASRASVPKRPAMWRSMRDRGIANIVSSWIDEAMPGQTADLGELWTRIKSEIASADCLVLFVEPDDFPLKGALIEVGIALGLGKPVRIVAPGQEFNAPSYRPIGSWIMHPLVERFKDLRRACTTEIIARHCPRPTNSISSEDPCTAQLKREAAEFHRGFKAGYEAAHPDKHEENK